VEGSARSRPGKDVPPASFAPATEGSEEPLHPEAAALIDTVDEIALDLYARAPFGLRCPRSTG